MGPGTYGNHGSLLLRVLAGDIRFSAFSSILVSAGMVNFCIGGSVHVDVVLVRCMHTLQLKALPRFCSLSAMLTHVRVLDLLGGVTT